MAGEASITVTPNGPYLVSGAELVVKTPYRTDAGEPLAWRTGPAIESGERYALCRCGGSERKPFCDGTHARVGFDGTETAIGTYAERARRYDGPGLTVHDDRGICEHAGFCGTAATNVWKMVKHSDSTDVRSQMIAMIERCPSGALSYSLDGGATDNEPDLPQRVAVTPDGPLFVTGGIPVTTSTGEELDPRNRRTLCRCGASKLKPLCDGTHAEVGFTHQP
jgi:CDGSH-type Zn-finger protein